MLARQLETGFGCVPTSSMGRLFDAVASLVGVRHVVDYEAEAAIELEGLARGVDVDAPYRFALDASGGCLAADPGPVVRAVVADLRRGRPTYRSSPRGSTPASRVWSSTCAAARASTPGWTTVALGGGVFQNAVLLAAVRAGLDAEGFAVLRPRLLPPNDGGIALGQVLVAAAAS